MIAGCAGWMNMNNVIKQRMQWHRRLAVCFQTSARACSHMVDSQSHSNTVIHMMCCCSDIMSFVCIFFSFDMVHFGHANALRQVSVMIVIVL